jgi:hypothetical protein
MTTRSKDRYTTLIFSLLFHALFLFVALSVLYLFVILPIERNAFNNEIKENINKFDIQTKIKNRLNELDPNSRNLAITAIQTAQPLLKRYEDFYNTPELSTQITNKYLVYLIIAIIIIFILSILLPYLFLRFSCNYTLPIGEIIMENILLFILVGSFEIGFFWYIARKYIPVQPSTFSNRVVENIKNF